MDRATEIEMMEELLGLHEAKSFYMAEETAQIPVGHYTCEKRFADEQAHIFHRVPLIAAHSNEIPSSGDFITRKLSNRPLLITRDKAGRSHVFLNVCRHRGAELVASGKGCQKMFSCPYHAWTYSNDGSLKNGPHLKQGFPDIDKSNYSLIELQSLEQDGLIWVVLDQHGDVDIAEFIAPLSAGFRWAGMARLAPAKSDVHHLKANWKILAEGGIEAYHFKIAHRNTIGPHFLDNLSSYRPLGPHTVNILAKNSMAKLPDLPKEQWHIRAHSNVIFAAFPLDSFLLMEDHIAWISMRPLSAGETEIRLTTLAPINELGPQKMPHWAQNHAITTHTLTEDWALNEGIQRGAATGANTHFTLGRFESALALFNTTIDSYL